MQILKVTQGSDDWLAIRASHFTASEAPAMMGTSKYMTRNDLLRQKSTGIAQDVDVGKQYLFDQGHAAEAAARPIIEGQIGEDLYPVTVSAEVEGLPLLASLDGLTMGETLAWECKLYNAGLEQQILNERIEPNYFWQLEQQLLVSGAERVIFTASDGTPERTTSMTYHSQPKRRAALIAGWKQFAEDLKNYQHVEVIPAAVATPQMQLPSVSVQVSGSIKIRDNLTAFGDALTAYVERINKKPETDQDFADLEATVKTLKSAEESLESAKSSALGQVESIDAMKRMADQLQELARQNRLTVEKIVKAEKENRRNAIIQKGKDTLVAVVAEANKRIGKPYMPQIVADFAGKVKGLKTIASIQNAVDTELARVKIEAHAMGCEILQNMSALKAHAEYEFLFSDAAQLVLLDADSIEAIIKCRIADHKAAEDQRLEAEREKIRAEESAKLIRQQQEAAQAKQREVDEYQERFEEVRRVSALWIEAMQSAVAESGKVKEYAAEIKTPPAVDVWQRARDEVVGMLDDLSVAELSMVRIYIAKAKQERQRAA